MALTYEQSAELMKNMIFVGRVKVACLTYARYISDEASDVPAHITRLKWANQVMTMPDATASQITPTVVMDGAVQEAAIDTDGDSTIDDPGLQSATENAVNKMM
jgi:hypothetical protein